MDVKLDLSYYEERPILFKNGVLRKIYRPTIEKITGVWRKVHDEKLHYLYAPLNIIRVIKTRRKIWVWRVVGPGKWRIAYAASVGKPKKKKKETPKTNKRKG